MFDLMPTHVWEFGFRGDRMTYLIVERDFMHMIPGTTQVRFTVVNEQGIVIAESRFDTGNRIWLDSVRLKNVEGIESPILVLSASGMFEPGRMRQSYAMVDDRFDLIRTENGEGTARRNSVHRGRNYWGPAAPKQSQEQWEIDLRIGDRAKVLRSLEWLAASHDPFDADGRKDEALQKNTIARPKVTARVRELAERGDAWEREAATLVLERTRWYSRRLLTIVSRDGTCHARH